ncbi:MAG: hypothetical protein JWN30_2754 [Bacilli bacterium]|nr:hypothetical protein [Bacilli bacterium]
MHRGVIGVDLGGTSIKVAAVSLTGSIAAKDELATEADQGAAHVLGRIAGAARAAAAAAGWGWEEIAGVGVGMPAFLDFSTGVVEEAVNLGWKDVAAGEELAKLLAKPIEFNNDANVAALGEAWVGGGAGKRHVLAVTLGTGVGGGIIIDGKLYSGVNGMAGEIGHLVLDPDGELCGCGHHGCVETECSATAILREAKRAVEAGEQTALSKLPRITAKAVFDLAKDGDETCKRIVGRMVDRLGYSLALVANLLNPEVIVIGGGLSLAGDILYVPLRAVFERYALTRVSRAVSLRPATLGNDAGVLGAAKLVLQSGN